MFRNSHPSVRPNVTQETIGLVGFSFLASVFISSCENNARREAAAKQENPPARIQVRESDFKSPLADNEMPQGYRKVQND